MKTTRRRYRKFEEDEVKKERKRKDNVYWQNKRRKNQKIEKERKAGQEFTTFAMNGRKKLY